MRIKDARQTFLGIWLRRVIEGEPFEVWGGEQRRDLLYVDDAADAFLFAAVTPEAEGLALNVGGGEPVSLAALAEAMIEANGGGKYEHPGVSAGAQAHRHRRFLIDDRRFRTLSGWRPRVRLAEGFVVRLTIIAAIWRAICEGRDPGTPALAIPQTDPRAGYLAQRPAIDAAIARVLEGGVYILGREVEVFEAAFADFVGVAHAIGVASGTDAIELALRACEIGSGDLVFTRVAYCCCDCRGDRTGRRDAGADRRRAGNLYDGSTRAPAACSRRQPAGRRRSCLCTFMASPPNSSALVEIARPYGLRLIEDCAQSHGALYRDRPAGSFGDIGCFSFYPTKNLGALGDGGMVVTEDPALAAALREMREYGWRERYVSARRRHQFASRPDPGRDPRRQAQSLGG